MTRDGISTGSVKNVAYVAVGIRVLELSCFAVALCGSFSNTGVWVHLCVSKGANKDQLNPTWLAESLFKLNRDSASQAGRVLFM